ncbi:MAG: PspC domain-containing protein [Chitinophagaceae bacterium]|nr:PspC domain-containing protein [Chitinophagaceae bacterium]
MKKVININFQGRIVPIEESSYELLKQYTDSLRLYFANEQGRDEIINDIESRIGELFQERIKNGATCITDDDVNSIINNIGRPQELADAESGSENTYTGQQQQNTSEPQQPFTITGKKLYRDENNKVLGGVCSGIAAYFNIEPIIVRLLFFFSGIGFFAYLLLWIFVPASSTVQSGVRKRLYRNPEDRIIAGVCSGIASYFNINVWIPRILFLVPFISFFFRWGHFGPLSFPNFINFSFSPGALFLYIILWLVIPEASTTSEKLEMKGEKVDINSIKNSVKEEMKGVNERVKIMGKEAKEFGKNFGTEMGKAGNTFGTEVRHVAKRTRSGLGDIIVFIVKAFAYFIVGCVALSLVIALFALAIFAIGIFPLKNFLLTDGWQNAFAWGTLFFFIGVPVIGIITWIIRRLAKIKSTNNMMRYSFLALWLVGLFCFISLIVSVGRDFKNINTIKEENISLVAPSVNRLNVLPSSATKYYNQNGWFRMEPFASMDEDTAYVNNVALRLVRSANDSFRVTIVKMCNGSNRRYADTLANKIVYNITQTDSSLYLDKGIAITPQDKFRNQHVVVTIAVPVGKIINVSKSFQWPNWEHINGPWRNAEWDIQWDTPEINGWEDHFGEDMIMRTDGLYTLDGKAADAPRNERNKYRVGQQDNEDNNDANDSLNNDNGGYRYNQTQKQFDSTKKILGIQKQKALDSLNKQEEKIKIEKEKIKGTATPKQEAFLPSGNGDYNFVLHI